MDTLNKLGVPKLEGGLEKVDIVTGSCYIRHPTTQALRIVNYTPEQAAEIQKWLTARQTYDLSYPLIQDALPFLDDNQREELMSGYPASEFDCLFDDQSGGGDEDGGNIDPAGAF